MSAAEALQAAGLKPAELGPKEGLSLMNGTGVAAALAAFVVERASRLVRMYDLASALSFEALAGKVGVHILLFILLGDTKGRACRMAHCKFHSHLVPQAFLVRKASMCSSHWDGV